MLTTIVFFFALLSSGFCIIPIVDEFKDRGLDVNGVRFILSVFISSILWSIFYYLLN